MTCIRLATILLSVYVLAESFSAIAKMPGGLIHFCHKIKYALAFSSSLAFIYYSIRFSVKTDDAWQWLLFGSTGTLALFVWPRTVYRLRFFMNLLDDTGSPYL